MKLFFLSLILLCISATCSAQTETVLMRIEQIYNFTTDTTTVRLPQLKISGPKEQYHSIHVVPAFSYPGSVFKRPEFVDFEVQTVVKTKLKVDLYVVFVVDGETIFLSSNRSGVKRPVPGKRWVGERLIFRMPFDTLIKIKEATSLEIKMDAVSFPIATSELRQLQFFARRAEKGGG